MSPEERQEFLTELMRQVGVACLREFGFTLLADTEERDGSGARAEGRATESLSWVASPGAPDSRNEGEGQ